MLCHPADILRYLAEISRFRLAHSSTDIAYARILSGETFFWKSYPIRFSSDILPRFFKACFKRLCGGFGHHSARHHYAFCGYPDRSSACSAAVFILGWSFWEQSYIFSSFKIKILIKTVFVNKCNVFRRFLGRKTRILVFTADSDRRIGICGWFEGD